MNERNAACIVGEFLAYRVVLFGGVAYLVGLHEWSAWWFLAALMIAGRIDSEQDEADESCEHARHGTNPPPTHAKPAPPSNPPKSMV